MTLAEPGAAVSRKKPRPTSEELEAQADALLAKANEKILAELERHGALLERMQQDLLQPRNDPQYLRQLEDREAQRHIIANNVSTVHIVRDGSETWIGISVTNRREQAKAIETARQLGEHLEARVITHEPQ